MAAVENAWQSFVDLLPSESDSNYRHICGNESPGMGVAYEDVVAQLREESSRNGISDEDEGVRCALCAVGISQAVAVMEDGAAYHPQCVNFWINCVDEVLP